jgi:2-(1,2-epoxy-1,2-dihydrophenyl)acetyl-CoA isomerase
VDEQLIKTSLEDGIFTLAFNRPEAMNAMNQAVGNRVRPAIRLAARDPEVRVIVITGEGRAFCAGGDIRNLGKADAMDPLAAKYGDDPRWNQMEMRHERLIDSATAWDMLRTMPKPTIAMINGPAVGAGMTPALACDFRICSEAAFFNSGYINMGLSGDLGMTYHLVNVVGPAKAREILFFPRKIDAHEALRLGLVNKVVPAERLREETMAMARELGQGPTLVYGHLKENLTAAMELSAQNYFDLEARNFLRCFETLDHREAVTAFKEKRKPVFKGR